MKCFNGLPIANGKLEIVRVFCLLFVFCFSVYSVEAQSTNQSYPTPILSNEISGSIAARDVGDGRLTNYFYAFNAAQGDVFINVVTKNLNGDIDVFTADNLRPLTKITVYADASDSETGRVIYLRQPTKLILRVEGRSPNDDAATYRIKFAGSFAPAQINLAENSEAPTVKTDNQTDIRVNSVGTIIEVKPKPTPKPKETVAETKTNRQTEAKEQKAAVETVKTEIDKKQSENPAPIRTEDRVAEIEKPTTQNEEAKPAVIVTDEAAKKDQTETEAISEAKKDAPEKAVEKTDDATAEKTIAAAETPAKIEPKKIEKSKSVKALPLASLENIRLIVLFKDGSKIERPMSEVVKVAVDRGVLVITSKDGAVGRYSILDVEKMTIE